MLLFFQFFTQVRRPPLSLHSRRLILEASFRHFSTIQFPLLKQHGQLSRTRHPVPSIGHRFPRSSVDESDEDAQDFDDGFKLGAEKGKDLEYQGGGSCYNR